MKVNMYSICDIANDKYSIPFGIMTDNNEHIEAIRRFMYMLTMNPDMRVRAADYNLFLAGIFDDQDGSYAVDDQFNNIVNGAEVVKYLDDPSVPTFEILDRIYEERSKDVQN